MDVVDNNDFHVFDCWKQYLDFHGCCIWFWKTIFRFYMDVVDNNDFLDVFHVFGCWKQYLDFTWMLWIIMTSFSCIWLFQYDITWLFG